MVLGLFELLKNFDKTRIRRENNQIHRSYNFLFCSYSSLRVKKLKSAVTLMIDAIISNFDYYFHRFFAFDALDGRKRNSYLLSILILSRKNFCRFFYDRKMYNKIKKKNYWFIKFKIAWWIRIIHFCIFQEKNCWNYIYIIYVLNLDKRFSLLDIDIYIYIFPHFLTKIF